METSALLLAIFLPPIYFLIFVPFVRKTNWYQEKKDYKKVELHDASNLAFWVISLIPIAFWGSWGVATLLGPLWAGLFYSISERTIGHWQYIWDGYGPISDVAYKISSAQMCRALFFSKNLSLEEK